MNACGGTELLWVRVDWCSVPWITNLVPKGQSNSRPLATTALSPYPFAAQPNDCSVPIRDGGLGKPWADAWRNPFLAGEP